MEQYLQSIHIEFDLLEFMLNCYCVKLHTTLWGNIKKSRGKTKTSCVVTSCKNYELQGKRQNIVENCSQATEFFTPITILPSAQGR